MAIPRSKKYLKFIRSLPCTVTGQNNEIVAHHIRLGFFGMGIKPSDFRTVPLTHREHQKLHNIGEREYWDEHHIDWEGMLVRNMLMYIGEVMPTTQVVEGLDQFLGQAGS